MKIAIGSGLATMYQSSSMSLATCWKVTLQTPAGGPSSSSEDAPTEYGFTSHDEDITYDGLVYLASSGVSPSDAQSQTKLAPDNSDFTALFDNEIIKVSDLAAGVWDYAEVLTFKINWKDPSDGIDVISRGRLGQVRFEGGTFTAEIRGLTVAYEATRGRLYSPTCRAAFGDAQCGVDVEALRETGVIDSVSDNGLVLEVSDRAEPGPIGALTITNITAATYPVITVDSLPDSDVVYITDVVGVDGINGAFYAVKEVLTSNTFSILGIDSTSLPAYVSGGVAVAQGDAGYWDYGVITMTTGDAAGLSMEVKAYYPGTLTLQLQFPRSVAAGDEYSIVPGCGKRFVADCVTRYENGNNFRGEPYVPGMDRLVATGKGL
jgi:hypothetical protein